MPRTICDDDGVIDIIGVSGAMLHVCGREYGAPEGELIPGQGLSQRVSLYVSRFRQRSTKTSGSPRRRCCQQLGQIKAIQIHHLVPRSHEVTHKLLLRVVTCIDLCDGPKLGV